MIAAAFLGLVFAVGVVATLVWPLSRRSTIEQAFDDGLAYGDWPAPAELFDTFAAAADDASEAELKRLANQLSEFNRRLDKLKRQNTKGRGI